MIRSSFKALSIYVLFFGTTMLCAQPGIYDNRFFPMFRRPYVSVSDRPSHFSVEGFASTASRATGRHEDFVGIPELCGLYDLRDVANAFVLAGQANPLPSILQGRSLPFNVRGKIQSQGFTLSFEKHIKKNFSLGFYWYFMRVESSQEFIFKRSESAIAETDQEIDRIRRDVHRQLGLVCDHSSENGIGDFDVYMRLSNDWDYTMKFRRVLAGANIGLLLPSGKKRNPYNASSVPFGGNGHVGWYISGDMELEVKEDWKFGMMGRLSKRFDRSQCRRLAVDKEPYLFGPVVDTIRAVPGLTVAFSPYISFENLREGFGVRVQYSVIAHERDQFFDTRWDKTPCLNLVDMTEDSGWAADYFTLAAYYDFGKMKMVRGAQPVLTFAWDVPTTMVAARSIPKTHRVTFGVEVSF